MKNQVLKNLILENSTHPHKLSADSIVVTKQTAEVTVLAIKGLGVVTHDEHNTVVTESDDVLKYVQQEYNPVTASMQNAFD